MPVRVGTGDSPQAPAGGCPHSGLPALLVDATGDPRTIHQGTEAVRRDWPGSRLATLRGADQHAVSGVHGSACVDATVDAHLAGGTLPAADVTCSTRRGPAGAGGGGPAGLATAPGAGRQPPSAAITTALASSCTRARWSGPWKDSA
ncbi:alpha/beta hydrolase [Streptomyces sp. NPDC001220]